MRNALFIGLFLMFSCMCANLVISGCNSDEPVTAQPDAAIIKKDAGSCDVCVPVKDAEVVADVEQ